MPWRALRAFDDPRIGKLFRLRVASRRGIEVPPTLWRRLPFDDRIDPPYAIPTPLIARSAAEYEDTAATTAAGRYESVVVRAESEFEDACRRVAASMGDRGAVFVQPLAAAHLGAGRAGVAFFDGFHYARTEREGSNRDLTAGRERGEVVRADLVRGEAWSEWLARVGRSFAADLRGAGALDHRDPLEARVDVLAVRHEQHAVGDQQVTASHAAGELLARAAVLPVDDDDAVRVRDVDAPRVDRRVPGVRADDAVEGPGPRALPVPTAPDKDT